MCHLRNDTNKACLLLAVMRPGWLGPDRRRNRRREAEGELGDRSPDYKLIPNQTKKGSSHTDTTLRVPIPGPNVPYLQRTVHRKGLNLSVHRYNSTDTGSERTIRRPYEYLYRIDTLFTITPRLPGDPHVTVLLAPVSMGDEEEAVVEYPQVGVRACLSSRNHAMRSRPR